MNIEEQIDVTIKNLSELKTFSYKIQEIADSIIETIKNGGRILICGNGGSAADSQHFAAELVVKYKKQRKALPAIALTTDSSIITAIANDIGSNDIFSRQVEALAQKEDLLIAISTSGNSENVLNAVKTAKLLKIKTIALTGADGGRIKDYCDIILNVPSNVTNNIQEMHTISYHIICDIVENSFYS